MKKVLAVMLVAAMLSSSCVLNVAAASGNDNADVQAVQEKSVVSSNNKDDSSEEIRAVDSDYGRLEWKSYEESIKKVDGKNVTQKYVSINSAGGETTVTGNVLEKCDISITGYLNYTNLVIDSTISKDQLILWAYGSYLEAKTNAEKNSIQTNINKIEALYPDYVTVTAINANAFAGDTRLKSIKFPDTLKVIGNNAFKGCTALCTSDASTINEDNVEGLAPLEIPASCYSIGASAFQGCTAIRNVDVLGSGSIGNSSFASCNALKNINLSKNINSIGNNAFDSCIGLTQVVLPEYLGVAAGSASGGLGQSSFARCTALTDVTFTGEYLNAIFASTFEACTALRKCSIPKSVTAVGNRAFYGCTSMSTISMPGDVSKIGDYVFYDCNSLVSIDIPLATTTIGNSAFTNCRNLTSIVIPDKVSTLGTNLFAGCSTLKSARVGDEVRRIPNNCFSKCVQLNDVSFGTKLTAIGTNAFEGCSSIAEIELPDTVTAIEGSAFQNCSRLKGIKYPEELTTIGNNVFSNCTSLSYVIPNNKLSVIGSSAFSNCSSLTNLLLPTSITSIANQNAFVGCKNLKLTGYDITDDGFNYVCQWLTDNKSYIDKMSGGQHQYWAAYALLKPFKMNVTTPYNADKNVEVTLYCDDKVFEGDIVFKSDAKITEKLKAETDKTYVFEDKNFYGFTITADEAGTSAFSVHFPQELITDSNGDAINADDIVVYKDVAGKLYPVQCKTWVSDYGINMDNITGGTYYIGEKPNKAVELKELTLSYEPLDGADSNTIYINTNIQINPGYAPFNTTTERNLTWSVTTNSESCVATISESGVLKVVGEGKVLVKAKAINNVEASIMFNVIKNPNLNLGDANGDGKVTMADVVALQRVLAKTNAESTIVFTNADMDKNKKLTMADVVLIQKAIAKI